MSRVLIIGIGGFSGTYMQEYIKNETLYNSYDFFGIGLKKVCRSDFIKYKKIDVTKEKDLEDFICECRPDYIINFCGEYSDVSFEQMKILNLFVTNNIINIVLKKGITIKKLLVIGSAAEYGTTNHFPIQEKNTLNPNGDYGATKKMQTEAALEAFQKYNFPVVIARTFNLHGNGISENLLLGKYEKLIQNALDGSEISLSNSESIRDFIHIKDAVEMYWHILIYGTSGEVYNVCTGKGKRVIEMIEQLVLVSGKKIKIICKENSIEDKEIKKSIGDCNKINNLMSAVK